MPENPPHQYVYPAASDLIVQAVVEVNSLLQEYVRIHNNLYRSSLRRILPIPRLFESIDFKSKRDALVRLDARLEDARRLVEGDWGDNQSLRCCLFDFLSAFEETQRTLRQMCERLYAKSQNQDRYRWSEYRSDSRRYDLLRLRQREIGIRLNSECTRIGISAP